MLRLFACKKSAFFSLMLLIFFGIKNYKNKSKETKVMETMHVIGGE